VPDDVWWMGTMFPSTNPSRPGGLPEISSASAYTRPRHLQQRRIAEAFLIATFSYVFLANAWLGDDAYITYRVVWNFLNGYGPVFNPPERVQAYTHPLWMLVMSGAYAITREFFFTGLMVSYAFAVAAVMRVARSSRSIAGAGLALLLLLSSKAFVDYTSSGLEYPLSYFLLAWFYVQFVRLDDTALLETRHLRVFGVLAGLAFVNRIDTALLYAGPLIWLALRSWRQRDRILALLVPFAVPVIGWLLFATLYYGFPLPNTYYAKVATGIPSALLYRQGLAYVLNSIGHDPITLGIVAAVAALAFRSSVAVRLSAASALAYVVYTVSVGGDFMSGRFFALPFLISVVALLPMLEPRTMRWMAAGLVLYNILIPLVPAKTTAAYDAGWPWRSQNGIKDERGHYHRITNVLFFSPFRQLPDHTWMREGLSFRNGPDKVTVQGSIGFYGLMAGPAKHIVDRNALSDPLLARLPVSPRLYFEFFAGHYFRDIPEGYLESIVSGQNQLTEPSLHGYYERLRNVVSGRLLTMSRLRDIWYLNAGEGRRFAARYEQGRPISLSIRAVNERFSTDVGDKDQAAGVIRSTGRAGYLQTGPGIPMKRGLYRARWIGILGDVSGDGPIGFVDVWSGDRQLARQVITATDVRPDVRQLAEIAFALPDSADALEYRFWMHGQHAITLERVELFSVRELSAEHP
jgi:arabinofuranosyltransferase